MTGYTLAVGYTCFVIIVKYVFAFRFWSDVFEDQFGTQIGDTDPFSIPRIVGLENRSGVRYLDIAQLLVLFFQRGLLKVHGLWENYDEFEDLDEGDPGPIQRIGEHTMEMISGRFRGRSQRGNDEPPTNQGQNCCVSGTDSFLRQIIILLR